ncbi:MAG: hypothetical protein D3907_01840, partial [Candidatus Electrothrix sp. AUS3]|nr:hypothetical protein [Candidatus Electrothrix gigas]
MSTSSDDDKNVNVNTGIYGDYAYVDGGISIVTGQDPDNDAFIEENLDDVRSHKFIPPTYSQEIVERVLSNKFLLLLGRDRMGKAALARHIAEMLLQKNSDKLSVKKIRQNVDLIDVSDALNSEKTKGHIILGYDINIAEIDDYIDLFRQVAWQNSKFIILTSELSSSIPSGLQEFSVEVQVNYPYLPTNIENLLEQYFQDHEIKLNVELKKNIHDISNRLVSPSIAIRLAKSLFKEAKATLPAYDQWIERLNDLKDFTKEVDNWLSSLGKNERILFLTLALFHNLPDHDFWPIYEKVIDWLRTRDDTLIKLDYYALEENCDFIVLEPNIAFKHIADRNIILSQLLKLHRRSLLEILPFLRKEIDKYKNNKEKESW